jgi:hypothetical protein
MAARRLALLFGILAGGVAGWLVAGAQARHHSEDLFSPRPIRRLAALRHLAAAPAVETVRVLRDYAAWEPHPYLKRRAVALARRMESALG